MQESFKKDGSIKQDSNQSQKSSYRSYSPNKRISYKTLIKSSRPASVESVLRSLKDPSQVSFSFTSLNSNIPSYLWLLNNKPLLTFYN